MVVSETMVGGDMSHHIGSYWSICILYIYIYRKLYSNLLIILYVYSNIDIHRHITRDLVDHPGPEFSPVNRNLLQCSGGCVKQIFFGVWSIFPSIRGMKVFSQSVVHKVLGHNWTVQPLNG